jgi:hypothetical protein
MFLYQHATFGQDPPPWFKGKRNTRREPADVTTVMLHQSAVAGGFGAADLEARAARYAGTSESKPGTPYHYIYSPRDHAVCAIWHPELYSWHGDGGNAPSWAFCVDGKYPGDPLDRAELAAAFVLAVQHAASVGFAATKLEAHRQHAAGRGGDPGPEIWPVIEIVAGAMGITPTLTRTTGDGQPIPASWRPQLGPGLDTIDAADCEREELRTVQGLLEARHHDPKGLDGLWGANTSRALADFKGSRGLPDGTVIDDQVWTELHRA